VADVVLASMTVATRGAPAFPIGVTDQTKRGYQRRRQADAEPAERLSARNRLGQFLGQFIEFIVHNFPFGFVVFPQGRNQRFS
jgi:hypothetical protein